jgi:uroporphyrinogen decarboxylase
MREMSSRERVLAAINHEEPDRVPVDLGGLATNIQTAPFNELKDYLGLTFETKNFLRDHVEIPEEILDRFGVDTRYIRLNPPKKSWRMKIDPDNSYVDEWGCRWKKPESSFYWDIVNHPLKEATIEDLEAYPWPDPNDPGRTEGLRERVKWLRENTDYAIVADMPALGIFELAWVSLRGPTFFMNMIFDKPFVNALLGKIADTMLGIYKNYIDTVGEFIDIINVSDDLGTQNGPLISLESYRELIKPYEKKLWQSIKNQTEAKLYLHSCGSIYQFIPDLIEMGVDIIDPVQVKAKDMETQKLKAEFGDRITFWGAIDTQEVLPFGTPEDVENEVKRRIGDLAPGGGYVLAPSHNIQPGVPPENVCTMFEVAQKYRDYPINI